MSINLIKLYVHIRREKIYNKNLYKLFLVSIYLQNLLLASLMQHLLQLALIEGRLWL